MPRYRRMNMRMMRDGRNPYGSRGGYVIDGRRMRSRMGEPMMVENYGYDERSRDYRNSSNSEYDSRRNDYAYAEQDNARSRRDYESGRQYDMASNDYVDMRVGRDGHYPINEARTYIPIEAMGTFNGYYGMPEQDYRGHGRDYGDYNYDMRGRGRDYGYYDYAGDYGESLSKEELEHWKNKSMQKVEEKDKHFFTKENIAQKAKTMGAEMKDYNEEELLMATLIAYIGACKAIKPYVGTNMDIYVALGKAWLEDKESEIKGSEKLAVYYDCIVSGEND